MHYKAMPILREIVTGLLDFGIEQHGCVKGSCLVIIPRLLSNEPRSKEILASIHLDVCGPMLLTSIWVGMHYMYFIDDFSTKTWIFFININDKVFNWFQEFKTCGEPKKEEDWRLEVRQWG